MGLVLILGSIFSPIFMFVLQVKWKIWDSIFHLFAILATLIFGNITAIAIYQVLVDGTVFMTTIHGILLNPFFLITGAYLGVFLLYTLLLRFRH